MCLDKDDFVYALAGHALRSLAAGNVVSLYDREGDQISPGDYALDLAHDYQGRGSSPPPPSARTPSPGSP